MNRKTLGDYLSEKEPDRVLWSDMCDIVFRDSRTEARLERLGSAALTLWDAGTFELELVNGGFFQFFDNSSGHRINESLEALRRIGAVVSVELLEKALAVFAGGIVPDDLTDRVDQVFAFNEKHPEFLEELSSVFYDRVSPYKSPREEDLNALYVKFMRAHAGELVEAPPRSIGVQ
jgi:hypothetical protein